MYRAKPKGQHNLPIESLYNYVSRKTFFLMWLAIDFSVMHTFKSIIYDS